MMAGWLPSWSAGCRVASLFSVPIDSLFSVPIASLFSVLSASLFSILSTSLFWDSGDGDYDAYGI